MGKSATNTGQVVVPPRAWNHRGGFYINAAPKNVYSVPESPVRPLVKCGSTQYGGALSSMASPPPPDSPVRPLTKRGSTQYGGASSSMASPPPQESPVRPLAKRGSTQYGGASSSMASPPAQESPVRPLTKSEPTQYSDVSSSTASLSAFNTLWSGIHTTLAPESPRKAVPTREDANALRKDAQRLSLEDDDEEVPVTRAPASCFPLYDGWNYGNGSTADEMITVVNTLGSMYTVAEEQEGGGRGLRKRPPMLRESLLNSAFFDERSPNPLLFHQTPKIEDSNQAHGATPRTFDYGELLLVFNKFIDYDRRLGSLSTRRSIIRRVLSRLPEGPDVDVLEDLVAGKYKNQRDVITDSDLEHKLDMLWVSDPESSFSDSTDRDRVSEGSPNGGFPSPCKSSPGLNRKRLTHGTSFATVHTEGTFGTTMGVPSLDSTPSYSTLHRNAQMSSPLSRRRRKRRPISPTSRRRTMSRFSTLERLNTEGLSTPNAHASRRRKIQRVGLRFSFTCG